MTTKTGDKQTRGITLPDKLFRRIAQNLQDAKLHKTLAQLAACSKNLCAIFKPILWQEVMWTKANFKGSQLFAHGKPEHFDNVKYIWLGSEGDGWFWKELFAHAPKDLDKTFDKLAHHFFPSLRFIAERSKPNPDNPKKDNVLNVWLSDRNTLSAYDYNAIGRLLLGGWNRAAQHARYRGKVPRILWDLPELPSLHSDHDPVEWAGARNAFEKSKKSRGASTMLKQGTFKDSLVEAGFWRGDFSIAMGPVDVSIYVNILATRKPNEKTTNGLLPHYTRLFRLINGLFYDQQKAMINEFVQFELFFWGGVTDPHPTHAWMDFMANYEDPVEHRRAQPPFKVMVQILADIRDAYQFTVWAVSTHLRVKALRERSPFCAERMPQTLDFITEDKNLPEDLQWTFQADYSNAARAEILRYGHSIKGVADGGLLALGAFKNNREIAGLQLGTAMKLFDDWKPQTQDALKTGRPGKFSLEELRLS